ncbi:Exosome complex protein [Homalodisca vitripennis]|nr:Exosome complex protein [Homalodisca vitripennis]
MEQKAPAGVPTRKHVVVPNVSAYGVTVDWVYGHLYWSDHSRIMVAKLDGTSPMAVIEDVDAPADMAVDPINGFIFWAECGHSLSLRRAGLSGDNVTVLASQVTCGVSLLADPKDRTLYWLDWAGDVFSCDYDYSQVTREYVGMARAIVVLHQRLLWVPWEHDAIRYTNNGDTNYHTHIDLTRHDVKLTSLKVMHSLIQPQAPNVCEDSDCPGLCLPSREQTVHLCLCADENEKAVLCTHYYNTTFKSEAHHKRTSWLVVVDTSPFSIILKRSGTLLSVFREFSVNVTEIDSLVDRHSVPKMSRIFHVDNDTLTFFIDGLNPATSYSLTVPNRVTRAAFSMVVHTAPPPLAVRRIPIVTVPGVAAPLRWHYQNIHYSTPNVWEDLVTREYLLLLISENEYFQSTVISIKQPIMEKLREETNGTCTILHYYKSVEQFDDDPEMYLANVPWGDVFSVAMVQVTEYKQVYNLDYIYSQWFRLPDPYWKDLLEDTLKEYRHKLISK